MVPSSASGCGLARSACRVRRRREEAGEVEGIEQAPRQPLILFVHTRELDALRLEALQQRRRRRRTGGCRPRCGCRNSRDSARPARRAAAGLIFSPAGPMARSIMCLAPWPTNGRKVASSTGGRPRWSSTWLVEATRSGAVSTSVPSRSKTRVRLRMGSLRMAPQASGWRPRCPQPGLCRLKPTAPAP